MELETQNWRFKDDWGRQKIINDNKSIRTQKEAMETSGTVKEDDIGRVNVNEDFEKIVQTMWPEKI